MMEEYNYEGNLKRLVKFKFSKIDNFEENFEPELYYIKK